MTSAKGLNEDVLTGSVAGDEYLCVVIARVRSIIRGRRRGGAHAMLVRRVRTTLSLQLGAARTLAKRKPCGQGRIRKEIFNTPLD